MNFSISCCHWCFSEVGHDDQHPLDAGGAGQNLDGGDGLDRLAQPHVVGHQRAAGLGGEQCPFALIGIERHLQQLGEGRRANAPRKRRRHALGQLLLVADLGDIFQRVVVAAQLVPVGRERRAGTCETGRTSSGLSRCWASKYRPASFRSAGRALRARPEHDFPPRAILQIDLGVWRLMTQGHARFAPGRRPSLPSTYSTCLQVPSVLTAKSGQEQKFSPSAAPRIATRYVRFVAGLVTSKSENSGSPPMFFTRNFCARPNSRRSPTCHSSSDISSGFRSRESPRFFTSSPNV